MKKLLQMKAMLLLCALIAGSGSAWAQAPENTIMWSETWTGATTATGGSNSATPSANYGKGTTVYNSGTVTYTQSANTVYVRNDALAGGTAPELLLSSGKTWTISDIPTGGAVDLSLIYKSNNTKSSVTCSTSGTSISGSSTSYTITTGGAETITLVFSCSGNTRIDNVELKVKTAGGDPSAVATPKFTPAAGTYDAAQNVEISCATADATIYYTTDGSTPTTSSYEYSSAISVTKTTTIKAFAVKADMDDSAVAEAVYVLKAQTPEFSVTAGTYDEAQSVELTCATAGATIYYTIDGSTPTTSSSEYSSAISVAETTTIKAIAVKDDWENSDVATAAYTLKVKNPTFSVAAGTYSEAQSLEISCDTEGATIHYTKDGSTPTSSSPTYSSAIEINGAVTIKAIAVKENWAASDVVSASYDVVVPVPGLSIDFETDKVSRYSDWEFDNIGIHNSAITAHSGTKWGSNVNNSDNGVNTAYIKTKNKIAYPESFTCYVSKESDNTKASNWKIQVSSDGSSWTDVNTLSASGMGKGSWTKFSTDLTSHSNVYVRLYYDGTTAIRAVDDIVLTEVVPFEITSAGWASFSNAKEVAIPEGLTAYYAQQKDESTILLKPIEDGYIPANTGVVIAGEANTYKAVITSTGASLGETNLLHPWLTAGTPDAEKYYTLAVEGGNPVFKESLGGTLAAGKAYLVLTTPARELSVVFDNEFTGIEMIENAKSNKENGTFFNLGGQRVAQPAKGLYIVNGKKYVVK